MIRNRRAPPGQNLFLSRMIAALKRVPGRSLAVPDSAASRRADSAFHRFRADSIMRTGNINRPAHDEAGGFLAAPQGKAFAQTGDGALPDCGDLGEVGSIL